MAGAFQANAFQNNAFQTTATPPPAVIGGQPPTGSATNLLPKGEAKPESPTGSATSPTPKGS